MSARLFTAAWSTLHLASKAGVLWVQPVRTSRGLPRFWPEAEAFPYLELLAPDGWMLGVKDPEKFGRAYRCKLHIAGLPKVQAELDAIAAECGKPPALACFELDPADCHRSQFAAWHERKTGERVPELGFMHGFDGGTALMAEVEPAQLRLEGSISPPGEKIGAANDRKGPGR